MKWSPKQDQALCSVAEWLKTRSRPWYYLAGYAGTGKTTLAKHLAEGVEGEVLFAAYTGKAASVLRKAGCLNASTLHSLLYHASDDGMAEKMKMWKAELKAAKELKDAKRIAAAEAEIAKMRAAKKARKDAGPVFRLNPDSAIRDAKLLVLDECSMVNRELADDVLSFRTPVLVLGDPAQLPPVRGNGFFTSRKPDLLLTEIHRQAADNPIIDWATRVREGKSLAYADEGRCRRVRPKTAVDFDALGIDAQVLTGKNATRRSLNMRIRRSHGRNGELPKDGDKLVCLKNDHEEGLLNGVICYAAEDAARVDDEELSMSVLYEGAVLDDLPVASLVFDRYTDPEGPDEFIDRYLQQFDYGYALTVHKSQGSQWENVIIADDGFGAWDRDLRKSWLYTAITRASETLTIVA